MIYGFLADLVVMVHLAFVVFVVGGAFLVRIRPALAWVHIPAMAWGAVIELAGWVCPLTPLEIDLRARAGQAGYAGGFVDHYIVPIVYPDALTPGVQIALGVFVLALNAALYAWIWRARASSRPRGRGPGF